MTDKITRIERNAASCVTVIVKLCNFTTADTLFIKSLGEWATSFWALSLATQSLSTGLIAGKIWWIFRNITMSAQDTSRYMSIVWTLVESGALYCTTTALLLTFYSLDLNSGAILDHISSQVSVSTQLSCEMHLVSF